MSAAAAAVVIVVVNDVEMMLDLEWSKSRIL